MNQILTNFSKKITEIFNPKVRVRISPMVVVIAGVILVISIFGLRDVIITPLIFSLTGIERSGLWLPKLYWTGIFITIPILTAYLLNSQFAINKELIRDFGRYLFISSPLVYLIIKKRLFLDFWLDELMSIVRHIHPSVSAAVLKYPVPNNHVFSNLVTGIYVQLIGKQEMATILASPFILRLPYFISGILTILVVGAYARKYISKLSGYSAVILLTTTIPFLNFMVQVRGYSFSILLSSLLLLFIMDNKEQSTKWNSFGIVLVSCLLIYTIPSNVYYVIAFIAFFTISNFVNWLSRLQMDDGLRKIRTKRITNDLRICLLLVGGIILSIVFYAPILPKMLSNSYVKSYGLFRGTVFSGTFQSTLNHFISNRWLILILSMGGVLIRIREIFRKKNPKDNTHLILLIVLILFPFLVSFIRGGHPFERVFLVILPAFVLLLTIGISEIFELLNTEIFQPVYFSTIFFTILFLISNGRFVSSYYDIENEIKTNLIEEKFEYVEYRDNRMWASHYLEHYQVMPIIRVIEELPNVNLVLVDKENTRYEWVITTYLGIFNVPYQEYDSYKSDQRSEIQLVMSYPGQSFKKIYDNNPVFKCYDLLDLPSIYQIYTCDLRP